VDKDWPGLWLSIHRGWLKISWLVGIHHWLIIGGLHAIHRLGLGCGVVHDDGGSSVAVTCVVHLGHGECSGLFLFPPDNDGNDDNESNDTTDDSTGHGSCIVTYNSSTSGVPSTVSPGEVIETTWKGVSKVGVIIGVPVGAG
jgi:hypothetical protein